MTAPAATRHSPLTKDRSYSDVLYVEQLIAPGIINMMPEKTLRAFAKHGNAERALSSDLRSRASRPLGRRRGRDGPPTITRELEHECVQAFCDSYQQLPSCIESKLGSLTVTP